MSNIFFTSDIHLNHKQILRYCPERRLGKDLPENDTGIAEMVSVMNEHIIENWNTKIPPGAEVYILGDVAMGKIAEAPALIARLNGRKHIILGNHDKTLVKLPIFQDPITLEKELGVVEVTKYKTKTFSVFGKKYNFVMFHFPIAHWEGQHHGNTFHLHGHLHGAKCSVPGQIMDVGMDTNNLTPYSIEEVTTIMLSKPVRESHHSGVEL